ALVVTAPFLVFARAQPELLAADPGLIWPTRDAGGASAPWVGDSGELWQMALGFPGPAPAAPWLSGEIAQWVPWVLGAVMVFLALLGLLRRGRAGKTANFAWLIIALGLATALGQSRIA